MSSTGPPVAVFDLDGTLTRRDTSLRFLAFVSGGRAMVTGIAEATVMGLPDLIRSVVGGAGGGSGLFHRTWGQWEGRLHERVVSHALGGLTEAGIHDAAQGFVDEILDRHLAPAARELIEDHLARGHRTALASASLEVYVALVAERLGMDGAVGTRLEIEDGIATGRFDGPPCWGAEKLERVRDLIAPWGGGIDHAYGNGRGDRELMAAARHATRVG